MPATSHGAFSKLNMPSSISFVRNVINTISQVLYETRCIWRHINLAVNAIYLPSVFFWGEGVKAPLKTFHTNSYTHVRKIYLAIYTKTLKYKYRHKLWKYRQARSENKRSSKRKFHWILNGQYFRMTLIYMHKQNKNWMLFKAEISQQYIVFVIYFI